MTVEQESFTWDGGSVSAVWPRPPRGETCVVLGHGAGGTLHTPGLAQFAEALTARGVGAVRFNFPYTEAKRKIPDRQAILEACYRAVAGAAAGLLFLGYPLHPPGQPDRLRDAHLGKIAIPMLFLQGSRDSFARPDLLAKTIRQLPTATLHVVEGGDHGLTVRGRPAQEVIHELAEVSLAWIGTLK